MTTKTAGPWELRDGRLIRRTADGGDVRTVARVYSGPAGTSTAWTVLRPDERTYGYVDAHDAQRWADFDLREIGYTLTPGPLDPPPLVERKQRGCLAAAVWMIVVGIGLIAAAIGVGVWL